MCIRDRGRTVHQDWEEAPEWRPDHRGEVRNRDFYGGDFKGILELSLIHI